VAVVDPRTVPQATVLLLVERATAEPLLALSLPKSVIPAARLVLALAVAAAVLAQLEMLAEVQLVVLEVLVFQAVLLELLSSTAQVVEVPLVREV
jgi:hypothetical protein